MSDLTAYISDLAAYIMPCPNCGVIPEPEVNTEFEIRVRCDSCGFSSLYLDTVDDALRNWEEFCKEEYMQRQLDIERGE